MLSCSISDATQISYIASGYLGRVSVPAKLFFPVRHGFKEFSVCEVSWARFFRLHVARVPMPYPQVSLALKNIGRHPRRWIRDKQGLHLRVNST